MFPDQVMVPLYLSSSLWVEMQDANETSVPEKYWDFVQFKGKMSWVSDDVHINLNSLSRVSGWATFRNLN